MPGAGVGRSVIDMLFKRWPWLADVLAGVAVAGISCPITDLENADTAYEFLYGGLPADGQAVGMAASAELSRAFATYQDGLAVKGLDGATLTADRY
jgi:hypothetical protein